MPGATQTPKKHIKLIKKHLNAIREIEFYSRKPMPGATQTPKKTPKTNQETLKRNPRNRVLFKENNARGKKNT